MSKKPQFVVVQHSVIISATQKYCVSQGRVCKFLQKQNKQPVCILFSCPISIVGDKKLPKRCIICKLNQITDTSGNIGKI